MPTKSLPQQANLDHLKHQAKDLLRDVRQSDKPALQRIREFHPKHHDCSDDQLATVPFTLADAQLTTAREYGISSWSRLHAIVCKEGGLNLDLAHHERITNEHFRQAVDLVDEGNLSALRQHLETYPELVHQSVKFEGGNYFQNPTLLEFVAENPVRHDSLPDNIVAIAKLILDAGARTSQNAIDMTLSLVCSGRVVREHQVQVPLIDLLCDYGADADSAMPPALGHGEFDATQALIRRGATPDLTTAAALGWLEDAEHRLQTADAIERHSALAVGTQHGRLAIVDLLLSKGEDPNRYNPVGYDAHATPLHQAAFGGHMDVVQLLVKHGARPNLPDTLFNATATDWARHAGQDAIAEFLERCEKTD